MKCNDCKEYECPNRNVIDTRECFYTYDLPKKSDFDWQSFRAEAAKDILCAIINRESSFTRNGEVVVSHQDFIEIAIEDADALIAKLKEKEEK